MLHPGNTLYLCQLPEHHDIDWYLERLEGVEGGNGSWQAWCPVHDDIGTSVKGLSVSTGRNGKVLCTCHSEHCKAGIKEVTRALENGDGPSEDVDWTPVVRTHKGTNGNTGEGMQWWVEKTGVPAKVWEDMGCVAYGKGVAFTFEGETYYKYRHPPKVIGWDGVGEGEAPAFWPLPDDELPNKISIWEGESDAGTANHGGLPQAYAVTKGAKTPIPRGAFEALSRRGVREVLVGGDADDGGIALMARLSSAAVAAGLTVSQCRLDTILDPFSGINDLNGVYRAAKSKKRFKELIAKATQPVAHRIQVYTVEEMEQIAEQEIPWLIPDLIAPGDKVMLAAPQKSLKSWLALELSRSLATASAFLKRVEWVPERRLRVGFIQEEGAPSLWARRISMLNVSGNENLSFSHRTGFRFTESSFTDEVISRARDLGWDILILDPLQRMMPGLDANSDTDTGVVWDEVFRIQQALPHLVVMIVHHANKEGGLTWNSIRGSSRHGGEVDLGIFIERHPMQDATLRMWLDGRDIPQYLGTGEAFEVKYKIDRDERIFEMDATEITVAVTNPAMKGKANKQVVLDAVKGGHDTRTKIMHNTEMSDNTVIQHLTKLVEEGTVTETDNGPGHPKTYTAEDEQA